MKNTIAANDDRARCGGLHSFPGPHLSDAVLRREEARTASGLRSMGTVPGDDAQIAERVARLLKQTYLETTRALVATVEARDPFTLRHSRTVSLYSDILAATLELSPDRRESLRTAALLHDIGKIGIPDAILQKPGPLTEDEFNVVKRHPGIAIEILGHASFLRAEIPIILHHHEAYDGSGYPHELAGTDIPFESRILAVADAIDTMLSPRSYKRPYSPSRVKAELIAAAGRQFDPQVAQVAHDWLDLEQRGPAR